MAVINTYAHVLGRELTNDEYEQAAKLGWLIELLQASLLVADDIEDGDEYRRDRPSWHMVPDVGMIAINDACLLKCTLYVLLRQYFGHLPCYADLSSSRSAKRSSTLARSPGSSRDQAGNTARAAPTAVSTSWYWRHERRRSLHYSWGGTCRVNPLQSLFTNRNCANSTTRLTCHSTVDEQAGFQSG